MLAVKFIAMCWKIFSGKIHVPCIHRYKVYSDVLENIQWQDSRSMYSQVVI